MKIIIERSNQYVSWDVVREFEKAILSSDHIDPVENRFLILGRAIWKAMKIISSSRVIHKRGDSDYFTVLIGMEIKKCFPYFLYARSRNVYIFDVWPDKHDEFEFFVNKFNIDNVFFPSLQMTEAFKKRKLQCNFYWIPEGVDPAQYRYREYGDKDIDVLQFGRKYNWYHEQIEGPLYRSNKKYMYSQKEGGITFPARQEFIDGLARSKVSICVPCNITHPQRSGYISTMTNRYLQSMASKCLIVGILPSDMESIFGYNPVIEIDAKNPVQQLLHILEEYEKYIPLIEKNYQAVAEKHTWAHRWNEIERLIKDDKNIN